MAADKNLHHVSEHTAHSPPSPTMNTSFIFYRLILFQSVTIGLIRSFENHITGMKMIREKNRNQAAFPKQGKTENICLKDPAYSFLQITDTINGVNNL